MKHLQLATWTQEAQWQFEGWAQEGHGHPLECEVDLLIETDDLLATEVEMPREKAVENAETPRGALAKYNAEAMVAAVNFMVDFIG